MDVSQTLPRERSQPSYQRAPSRSSTSQSNSRPSQPPLAGSSPRLSNAHPAHRHHQNACARSTNSPQPSGRNTPQHIPRLTPQLSREGSLEPAPQSAVSPFLQERLQKERKAHSDRLTHSTTRSRTNLDMSASVELDRSSQGSQGDFRETESRPWSSSGDPAKQKGMGWREMEQSMSDLHKKNFNLKLEVSKRRDMQIQLEARMEDVEAKKAEMEDMNDKLLQELEKRDSAVGEAVAHIVRLEAEVEQLKEERLNRRMQSDCSSTSTYLPDRQSLTPKPMPPTLARLKDDTKVLNRIPSFLSEQTEDTETLRKVYLSLNGSALTLPRLDRLPDDDMPTNGLPSPTALSTLSESSFTSVYGQRDKTTPPNDEEPQTYDGVEGSRIIGASRPRQTTRSASANLEGRSTAKGRTHNSQYQLITEIIGQGSPLQRIERLDPQYAKTPRPQSSGTNAGASQPAKSPRQTRDEKRGALRRVVTDAQGGVRLHEHALPPTPDTISTTTLRRFQNSNDTLALRNDSSSDRSRSREVLNVDEKVEPPSGALLDAKPLPTVPDRTRNFSGDSYFDLPSSNSQRPYSADDTTVSYRRGNDWYSDSDDGDRHAPSIESDIWMQESGRINRDEGRISPDLFGFPASASRGAWATDAMFGPSSAQFGGASLHPDDQRQDLFAAQQTIWSEGVPPPPPNRRSSLHARTGSQSADTSVAEQSPPKDGAQKSPCRKRYQRRNSDDGHRAKPAQPQFYQPAPPVNNEGKKNHYPPIAGQQGQRAGLNWFFRRSSSVGPANGKPEMAAPTGGDASFADPPGTSGIGVPYWASKTGVVDDDRSGATPPPISRNPRHARADSWAASTALPLTSGPEPGSPDTAVPAGGRTTPMADSPAASGTGTRRKWLPSFVGRSNSLKNKNG